MTNALATRQETVEDLAVTNLTTEELVVVIQQEHELVEGAASAAISHAIRCGLALLEIRGRVPNNQWTAWAEENLPIDRSTASVYIRIAYYREHILSSRLTSVNAARTYLKELPSTGKGGSVSKYPDELRKEAKRLYTGGLTLDVITDLLGAPRTTIYYWLHPENGLRNAQRMSLARAKRKAARAALRQKERAENAKRAGGKIDKAYSLLRRCLSETDGALEDATDPDRRVVLRAVITHLQRAEEEMGKV